MSNNLNQSAGEYNQDQIKACKEDILSICKKHLWNYDLSEDQLMLIWSNLQKLSNICFTSYVKAKNKNGNKQDSLANNTNLSNNKS